MYEGCFVVIGKKGEIKISSPNISLCAKGKLFIKCVRNFSTIDSTIWKSVNIKNNLKQCNTQVVTQKKIQNASMWYYCTKQIDLMYMSQVNNCFKKIDFA